MISPGNAATERAWLRPEQRPGPAPPRSRSAPKLPAHRMHLHDIEGGRPKDRPAFHNPVSDFAKHNKRLPLGERYSFHKFACAQPGSPKAHDYDNPISDRAG